MCVFRDSKKYITGTLAITRSSGRNWRSIIPNIFEKWATACVFESSCGVSSRYASLTFHSSSSSSSAFNTKHSKSMFKSLVVLLFLAFSLSFAGAAEFQLSTHVLDTSLGKPGVGVEVILEKRAEDGAWTKIAKETTGKDGRIGNFLKTEENKSHTGVYRLTFSLEKYFAARGSETVFPEAVIVFKISDETHYHIPLVVTPFALSTYRGS